LHHLLGFLRAFSGEGVPMNSVAMSSAVRGFHPSVGKLANFLLFRPEDSLFSKPQPSLMIGQACRIVNLARSMRIASLTKLRTREPGECR